MTDEHPTEQTDPTPATESAPDAPASDATKTSLARPWLLKMIIFIVVLIAFGSWGLYDAISLYPAKGRKHASFAHWQYLGAAANADREELGFFVRQASVDDPAAELEQLSDPEVKARNEKDSVTDGSSRQLRATAELERLNWLRSLRRVSMLDPEHTATDNPRLTLQELNDTWSTTKDKPSPLEDYDIPLQWVIMVVCYGIALYLLFLFISVATKSYTWDPESKTLSLPGGASLTPGDLDEVDKRKWDKFLVFLRIKPGHPKLGGQELKLDLYRYSPLEAWVLEMEQIAFPDQQEDDAPPSPTPPPATPPGGEPPKADPGA